MGFPTLVDLCCFTTLSFFFFPLAMPRAKEPKELKDPSAVKKRTKKSAAAAASDDGPTTKRKKSTVPTPPDLPSQAFPYTNLEIDTEDDSDEDEVATASPAETEVDAKVNRYTVMSLAHLYKELCSLCHVKEGEFLGSTPEQREMLNRALLDDIFGGLVVAKPRTKPTKLHAAYFGNSVAIVLCKENQLILTDDAVFDSAPILSVPRDSDTRQDKPIKDRMKLILSSKEWPPHLLALLNDLDYFVTIFCAELIKDEIYADSGLDVPSLQCIARRWEKGLKIGEAPMRHFVDTYKNKDAQGNETDEVNTTLDFSITTRERTTTAHIIEGGQRVESAVASKPGLLRRGDRVFASLLLRGINLLPTYQRIGPNVLSTMLWCKRRAGAMDLDDVDYSDVVAM